MKEDALQGVPTKEHEEYFKNHDGCWRCVQTGHRTYKYFAHTTKWGTPLPKALWKAAGVTSEKRKRSPEPEPNGTNPAKQQKIAAVETREIENASPLWANDSEDSDI